MPRITNEAGISLPLAVWLLHDAYDYVLDPDYVSATTLMRSTRQIVLGRRVNPELQQVDISEQIPRALGHAIHDSIEKAWRTSYVPALKLLGYSDSLIEHVRINPHDNEVLEDPTIIPVYIEQRMLTEAYGWKIGGKFDMVTEGVLNDFKSTSAWSWMYGGKDEDYALQGSLYRWLDSRQALPKIKDEFVRINFIFTDWSRFQAKQNPAYPQKRVETRDIRTWSLEATENWVRARVRLLRDNLDKPEEDLPYCTSDELWMSETVHKYFANPLKTDGRATKNFSDLNEAQKYLAAQGNKGVVVSVLGVPKRCEFCSAYDLCTQKNLWYQP